MAASETYVLRPEDLDVQQHALYVSLTSGPRGGTSSPFEIADRDGALRGPFAAMLLAPVAGDAVQRFGSALRFGGTLDAHLREVAILVVARETRSIFERTAHESVAKILGVSEGALQSIRNGGEEGLSLRERRCAELAQELVTGCDARASDYTRDFTSAEIYELSAVVGYYRMLATHLHLFELDEPAPQRPEPATATSTTDRKV